MPVSEEVLARAKRLDRRATEAVVLESFPSVYRMAHALTGRHSTAARVIRLVLTRAVRVLPGWRKGVSPENWFYHHTLLTARDASMKPPDAEHDLLVTAGKSLEPAYVAFIRALRNLPRQQMEAFVLHHGEKLNARLLGVAMDCSTQAATTHLSAATAALESMTAGQLAPMTGQLSHAYSALSPPEKSVVTLAQRAVGAVLWRKRLRRLVRRLVLLILLACLAWAGWHWRDLLLQWFSAARSRVTSRPA